MKADKETYKRLCERVVSGIRHSRHEVDGDAAYLFTPHQMGALHRAMREASDGAYYYDIAHP